jgi:sec-independent protein translocase protein TatA
MGLDNPIHIAFLLILLLLVFGAKRLPEMGRSLGDGMRGFKDALSGEGSQTAAQPATQPTLVAQQQEPVAAAAPAQAAPAPVQAVPAVAPMQAVPAPQPVMQKLPA